MNQTRKEEEKRQTTKKFQSTIFWGKTTILIYINIVYEIPTTLYQDFATWKFWLKRKCNKWNPGTFEAVEH